MLVPNFAYKFFNYVLKCYNALCTAEFVNNNGKMGFVLLEYSQKFADFVSGLTVGTVLMIVRNDFNPRLLMSSKSRW